MPDQREADALLGLVPEPPLTVSKAHEEYWTAAADRTRGKSADKIRRWENPRKKAVANFIKAVGDVALPKGLVQPGDLLQLIDVHPGVYMLGTRHPHSGKWALGTKSA